MATGQPVDALLDLDADMLLTLEDVHRTQWTRIEHMLATIIDAVGVAGHYALIGSHLEGKKLRGVKPPPLLPRPGERRKRRPATSADLKRVFAAGSVVAAE